MKTETWLATLADDARPSFAECLQQLGDLFPELHRFAATEQDPQWHAEGDVAIHTAMVLDALYTLLAQQAAHLRGSKRQALILGALLHDIAKPITTQRRHINGVERVVAPRHEELGRNLIAVPLMALGLDYRVVEQVLGLVGYHQQPKLLVVRNGTYADYLRLAINADLELLYWLEVADMRGRHCPDQALQLQLLDEYRLFAEDYGLWQQPGLWARLTAAVQVRDSDRAQCHLDAMTVDDLVHGRIVMAEEAIARHHERAERHSRLYVMCGISGSGKSTWVSRQLPDARLISLDELREQLNGDRASQKQRGKLIQLAKARLKTALAAGEDVVWDATNIRRDFRSQICGLGRDYGALVTLVVFHLPLARVLAQDRQRRHRVDSIVIDDQIARMQWPEREEAHRQCIIGEHGAVLSCWGRF